MTHTRADESPLVNILLVPMTVFFLSVGILRVPSDTFLRTSLIIFVVVAGDIFPSRLYVVLKILFHQRFHIIFTFPIAPLLVISRDAPSISIQPIPSFHAYHENRVLDR